MTILHVVAFTGNTIVHVIYFFLGVAVAAGGEYRRQL